MSIRCPKCSVAVSAADVNLASSLGRCIPCNEVFEVGPQVRLAWTGAAPPMPTGFEMQQEHELRSGTPYRAGPAGAVPRLRMRLQERDLSKLTLLLSSLLWFAFLGFFYSNMGTDAPWIAYVFPLGHVLVGFLMLQRALKSLLNRTEVLVAGDTLSVYQGPIRLRRNQSVRIAEVRQLFVRRWEKSWKTKGESPVRYDVRAELTDGSEVRLVTELRTDEQARFIEHTVESHLRIADDPAKS